MSGGGEHKARLGFGLRVAKEGDIGALLALWALPDVHPTVTDTADAIALMIGSRPGSVIVAQSDEDGIVGSVIIGWDGWRGSLYRLAVSPSARRRGVGTALVSQALAVLRGLGCGRVGIFVVAEDVAATAFWDHCRELGIVTDSSPKVRYISNLV
jgi:ribosomal protein S18 acetylase RimI-like enzyme